MQPKWPVAPSATPCPCLFDPSCWGGERWISLASYHASHFPRWKKRPPVTEAFLQVSLFSGHERPEAVSFEGTQLCHSVLGTSCSPAAWCVRKNAAPRKKPILTVCIMFLCIFLNRIHVRKGVRVIDLFLVGVPISFQPRDAARGSMRVTRRKFQKEKSVQVASPRLALNYICLFIRPLLPPFAALRLPQRLILSKSLKGGNVGERHNGEDEMEQPLRTSPSNGWMRHWKDGLGREGGR